MFVPSLLEYTSHSLHSRIISLSRHISRARQLTYQNQNTPFHIHADVVDTEFARERSILKSLSGVSVFHDISSYFNHPCHISMHCMMHGEDIKHIWDIITHYKNVIYQKKHITLTLYIPSVAFNSVVGFIQLHQLQSYIAVGIWFDCDQWHTDNEFITMYSQFPLLLMTVRAGKSGQHVTPEVYTKIDQLYHMLDTLRIQHCDVLFDGGIDYENYTRVISPRHSHMYQLQAVSYSAFWNRFTSDSE